MRKSTIAGLLFVGLILTMAGNAFADGGQAGISPAAIKIRFGNGTDVTYGIQFRAEWHVDDEANHAVGGNFGYDFGTGAFGFSLVSINPYYHYYFNGKESGPYVGAYTDLRFRSSFSNIGVGPKAGYKFQINDNWGIWGEANVGFSSAGGSGFRSNGGEIGFSIGGHYQFGN